MYWKIKYDCTEKYFKNVQFVKIKSCNYTILKQEYKLIINFHNDIC